MWRDKPITLLLAPRRPIRAKLVNLASELAENKVMGAWWDEDCLDRVVADNEIDRFWNWNVVDVEFEGRPLPHIKVAVVTGGEKELAVQGAMVISTEPVASSVEPDSAGCLLLEYLFTAPRNRPDVRLDRKNFIVGVGTLLLICGAALSQSMGFAGRLRLDASPKFVEWYEKRGLQKLRANPMVYESTPYSPMELSGTSAAELLKAWD